MRIYRTTEGPFAEAVYYTDADIENLCCDELRNVGLLPSTPEPVRVDRFIEKRFKVTPGYENLPDGILGLTKFGPRGVEEVVIANSIEEFGSVAAERRIRSTLAHECGHG